MELGKVFVDSVAVGDRHRSLDADKIASLAESMGQIGLRQPISVYLGENDSVHLVAGHHRVEAARKLRWEQIDAIFVKGDEIDRELWEIAENLHRVDLTKEQRDAHIRRYAELIEAREAKRQVVHFEPPVLKDGRKKGPQHDKGIAKKVAEQTGLSKSTVRRALFQPDPVKVAEQKDQDKARREHDRAIETVASEEFANWLLENSDLSQVPQIISWLEGSRPKLVIDAIHRLSSDTPVFDRNAA